MDCCRAITAACSTATVIDFADLREYQPEDDIRYIDWNVTARHEYTLRAPIRGRSRDHRLVPARPKPVHTFRQPAAAETGVLIDFVVTIARLLTRHGNRVGAVLYGSRVDRTIPARSGRLQVLRLANDLLRYEDTSERSFTDLTPLIQSGLHAIKKRSLVFLISDFISAPGWERPLTLLSQRHEVLAVRLWDPGEVELPDVGIIAMEDSETGEQLIVDTHDRRFRERFAALTQQREETIRQAFKRAGVDALSLSTGDDLVREIMRFAAVRQARRIQHR
jgi:uncharacterized protein (DUF58 family)